MYRYMYLDTGSCGMYGNHEPSGHVVPSLRSGRYRSQDSLKKHFARYLLKEPSQNSSTGGVSKARGYPTTPV